MQIFLYSSVFIVHSYTLILFLFPLPYKDDFLYPTKAAFSQCQQSLSLTPPLTKILQYTEYMIDTINFLLSALNKYNFL